VGHVTFGELWDRWWDREGQRLRSSSTHDFQAFLQRHLAELRPFVLNAATAGAFADHLDRLLSEKEDAHQLAPRSLNYLRAAAFRVFEHARDPKCHLWTSVNPVRWVKRRRVPKRHYEVLRREEVAPVLASFPEPKLGSPWRWAAAVCLYVGARPGEAMGLWKVDVDTGEWVIAIRRSWGKPWPKDNEPRTVLIPTELRPVLLAAMRSSPNHLVFPRSSGEVFDPETRREFVDHLRRACAKAGVVEGYDHTCRRCKARTTRGTEGAPAIFTWRHPDAAQRECPHCRMKLWVKPVPRPVRFYDLRHSNATLLRKAGVDLGTVQKALGHSSPEITAAVYDHSELADDREALERALTFNVPGPGFPSEAARLGEPVGTTGSAAKIEAPGAEAFASDSEGFKWSGRQDSNLRPLGPENRPTPSLPVYREHAVATRRFLCTSLGARIAPEHSWWIQTAGVDCAWTARSRDSV
jgi:integrase